MSVLPRTNPGTWLLTAVAWLALCAAVWLAMPPQPRATLDHPDAFPWMFAPNGSILVTQASTGGGRALGTKFWEAETGRPLAALPTLPADYSVQAFSYDGRWARVSFQPDREGVGNDQLWDLATGRRVTEWPASEWVVFSPTDPLVAVTTGPSDNPTVRLFDLPSLAPRAELSDASSPVFSPDGRLLATVTPRSAQVTVWSIETARPVVTVPARVGGFDPLMFSPDSRTLIASVNHSQVQGPKDLEISVWGVEDGKERFRVVGEELLDSHRSSVLITSRNYQVRCYDLLTGQIRPCPLHPSHFFSGVMNRSVGGPWVAEEVEEPSVFDRIRTWLRSQGVSAIPACTRRPAVQIADLATDRIVASLPDRSVPVVSQNGRTLAVKHLDGIELFDIPPGKSVTWFALAAVLALPVAWLAVRGARGPLRRRLSRE